MSKLKIGDKVVKNPDLWTTCAFSIWGRGEGVGEVVEPPFMLDDGQVDVRWPTGRCFESEHELMLAPKEQT